VPARAARARSIAALDELVRSCRACPRLVAWREHVAAHPRAAYAQETYWGAAVAGFGPVDAPIAIVGLAPAAHGANRTGRMFTGDRSGDVLFAALHRAGLASQPTSTAADDGTTLVGVRITAPVHCAPPDNRPSPVERDRCAPFLRRELELLAPTVLVVLGAFGWQSVLAILRAGGWEVPRPRPRFGHGREVSVPHPSGSVVTIVGCYHVSQQNTFTGRLTPAMLDRVLARAVELTDRRGPIASGAAARTRAGGRER
jgi:uracil-DNA glycosylase